MSEFETPEWGEDLKEERWTSGLFEQSNAKVKETKNRNRNKYPKGFAKSELSSESKKANSSVTLKSPKPELLNKSPDDQIVTQTSKKKRNKAKTGGSEVPEHDAGEPPLKAQKTASQVSARSSFAHQNEKTSKKQKFPAESSSVQNSGQEAEEEAAESNKSSKSRKRKKNKGLSDTHSKVNEQPAKVKKLTENSTVKDELCASSANESVPQVTPKKRKRNRKKKKNASLETTEDKKPSIESSAQESTPKLSSSKRRRARKKKELERKVEENPNFKGNKKRKRRRSSHKSEGEATLKNGNLHVEGTEEKDDAASEKNVEGSEKSDKKRKSLEDTVSKGDEIIGNDSSSKLNESLETLEPTESSAKSKSKKKKKKKVKVNVSDEQTSPSAQIDVKLVNDEKDVEPLEEPSNLKEENGCNVDNSKGTKKKGPSLREKMEEKLKGARFR
ncbi:hypothetical protein J437_LFUL008060 [Ladona fulva]|uniref:Uncharacterized protein n=1 Tax=Ladona fulva TaxID=123851 RepID=A0A8K0K2K2_LADFU|nr:hypothetical protein J437_LFUL008060 [Ladona fulva]